jgi:hypothetical protein
MEKYLAGTNRPKFCDKHVFHNVVGKHWKGGFSSESGFVNKRGQTLKEWLAYIRDLYTLDKEEP